MSEQLSIDMPAGLPSAFIDRWRELGGPAVAGDSCVKAWGTWWIVVRVGSRKWAFNNRPDDELASIADELLALVRR